jgi:ribosomal protein L37AE/L43A
MVKYTCGDCAKFEKYHKVITKSGWYVSSCMKKQNVPEYISESQKDKYIKKYVEKRKLSDICELFVKENYEM